MNLWQRILNRLYKQPGETRVYIPSKQAGVYVNEDIALTYSAVFAAVRVISETIAPLPWGVYRSTSDGREEVLGGVSWLLNSQPNPEMTAIAFREAIIAHALTWGNGYAEIVKDMAGRPSAMFLMPPDRVCPKRDDDGSLYYEFRRDDGETVRLDRMQVFHLHGLGYDGVTGYSPVQMAKRSIGLGIAQEQFGQAFYSNGTTFGGMVEFPSAMNKQQIDDAEKYLNGAHQGPDKAFKTRVVPQGVKYHNPSMPMTDAQFLESRQHSVTDIARWFRVPPHKIGDLTRSTNNNIEHQGIEFVTDTVLPWVNRLEQEANIKLFASRAQGTIYTKINVNGLMRGDHQSRAQFYQTMVQIGAMTVNEVRALEEMNGIGEAGDQNLVQLNQTTLERLIAQPMETTAAEPKPVAAVKRLANER